MESTALKRLEHIRNNNIRNSTWINSDLYRLLYKADLYIAAYEKVKSNTGALTPGSTKETLDGFSLEKISRIIEMMRNMNFEFRPARRILIPKPGKKKLRPLGIPNATDKIVQEVLRMILEAIYEPSFSENSHGFRPQKSCHTALRQVEQEFDGTKWLLEGDIEGAYDTVNHKVLLKIMRRRIDDDRFLGLIKKALQAGYLVGARGLLRPLIGTPQGSIISPILFNIYMSPFDAFLEQLKETYIREFGGRKRKSTTQYNENATQMALVRKEIDLETTLSIRKELIRRLHTLRIQRTQLPAYKDESVPIRINYVRYADDWIVGINGPRHIAEEIKNKVSKFLQEELKLTLSPEKTKITYLKEAKGRFLGYDIYVNPTKRVIKVKNSKGQIFLKRTTGHSIQLDAPMPSIISRLQWKGLCDGNGRPLSKRSWTTMEDHRIVAQYRAIMNGILQYYNGAMNQRKLIRIQYILQHSCAATLSHRHQRSLKKTFAKYGPTMTVTHMMETKNGPEQRSTSLTLRQFNKTHRKWSLQKEFRDPFSLYAYRRTRSKLSEMCCICGADSGVEMHHVKHLKSTVHTKNFDQIMSMLNRKQIPVCAECHQSIHFGRYDGLRLSEFSDLRSAQR